MNKEQSLTKCYVATHIDSGRHYVGITKRSLNARKSEHESHAKNMHSDTPFHNALRKYGNDAFTWSVVAEGEDSVIRLMEHVLIEKWGTNELGGFNAIGGLEVPPIKSDVPRMFEEHQRDVAVLDMLNDLSSIVRYCEENYIVSDRWKDIKELGARLVKRMNDLEAEALRSWEEQGG